MKFTPPDIWKTRPRLTWSLFQKGWLFDNNYVISTRIVGINKQTGEGYRMVIRPPDDSGNVEVSLYSARYTDTDDLQGVLGRFITTHNINKDSVLDFIEDLKLRIEREYEQQ